VSEWKVTELVERHHTLRLSRCGSKLVSKYWADLLHDLGEVGGVGDGRQDLELEELDAGWVVVTAVEVFELVREDAWLGVG